MTSGAAAPAGLSLRRRLRRRFYWLLTIMLLKMAAVLPIRWGRRLGRDLARLAMRIRTRERKRAARNLNLAFPDLDLPARKRLLAASADALGRTLFDTLAVPRILDRPGLVTETAYDPATDRPVQQTIDELLTAGKGVLLLGSHLGCWELLGAWLGRGLSASDEAATRAAGRLAVVTGTVHNPPVNRLLQARRKALGLLGLPRQEGVAPLVRHLRKGGVAAVLLDQYTRVQNVPVPFFGREAPTPVGFGKLALRGDVPVLPVGIAWAPAKGVYEVGHLPPIRPAEVAAGSDAESRLHALLSACNLAVEKMIRRNPDQWVWFHRRWDD